MVSNALISNKLVDKIVVSSFRTLGHFVCRPIERVQFAKQRNENSAHCSHALNILRIHTSAADCIHIAFF